MAKSPLTVKMSRQSLIDNFFKSKATTPTVAVEDRKHTMNDIKPKKRNLSLIKPATPAKNLKKADENKIVQNAAGFSSDEDDIWESTPKLEVPCIDLTQTSNDSEGMSDCSANTLIYSPTKTVTTPQQIKTPKVPRKILKATTPQNIRSKIKIEDSSSPQILIEQSELYYKTELLLSQKSTDSSTNSLSTSQPTDSNIKTELANETLRIYPGNICTPQKPSETAPLSSSQLSGSYKSPQSREKFFSPSKKRTVVKKTPNKVKRRLSTEMFRSLPSRILFEDDLFAHACEGMDDKTIFLLEIINRCLNEPSVKRLLSTESQTLLSSCLQVVKPGMRLVCRLYWRKEGWYRQDHVFQICSEATEDEGDDKQEMMDSLVTKGLIVKGNMQNMNMDDYLAILKKDDLKQICKELKLKINSKQDAIKALVAFSKRTSNISTFFTGCTSSNSKRVLQMMNDKAGPCYRLSDLARNTLQRLYIIMYLGMDYSIIREKKLELTLLYDKIKRETYPIPKDMPLDNASVVFRNMDDFERYFTAHQIYEDFIPRADVTEKCNIVKQVYNLYKSIDAEEMARSTSLPQWLHRYTPAYLYIKILEIGIQDLKRDKLGGHFLLALNILSTLIEQTTFRQHKKAHWFDEKALILQYLNRNDEAAEVLLKGFKSDLSEEAKDSLRPRARKLANQKNITVSEHLKKELLECGHKDSILEKNLSSKHVHKQPMDRSSTRGKVKFETRSEEGLTVQEAEEFCIGEYLSTGEFTDGVHWEGRIVTTLFFLLFWDIIYSKPPGVKGVFMSHYQRFPLDLFTDSFYSNRKEIIDNWLNVIEEGTEEKILQILKYAWDSRPETELSVISAVGGRWARVRGVAACLGPRRLARVCRRLARDYRYAHSAFPDLTLWNELTGRIKFVEVKTDSDKPSLKQIQWMHYLQEHGIETEFCYVGVNTMRQRSRTHVENRKPAKSPVKAKRTRTKKVTKKASESPVKIEV